MTTFKQTTGAKGWETTYLDKLPTLDQIRQYRATVPPMFNDEGQLLTVGDNGSGGTTAISSPTATPTSTSPVSLPDNITPVLVGGDRITIPTGDRKKYHADRYNLAKANNYAGYGPIDDTKFKFKEGPKENNLAPDWIQCLYLIWAKVKEQMSVQQIYVTSGLRMSPEGSGIDAHMGGLACDISFTGDDRYKFADICWNLGLRGVAVGSSFVHIDGTPDPITGWSYGSVPVYRGPGSPRG